MLYEKSFGTHTPDTPVHIASAGKWLAAAAILAVVEEGKLSLDDPAIKWLPEFGADPKGRATLRQMFAHTSGYPPYQPDDKPRDNYQTAAESVAHLLPLAPFHEPGERFEYGGLAMQVAARMAEVATGKTWEEIFQEKIARPLGMTRTRFTPVDPDHTPMVGGGAVSTLRDYSRFLTMLANDGVFENRRILTTASIRELFADQVGTAHVKREEFVERMRGNTHRGIYGVGCWREEIDADGNAMLISSPSWAGTYPWLDKCNNVRALIIAHVDTTSPVVRAARFSGFWTSPVLAKMVRAELAQPASTPAHSPDKNITIFERIISTGTGDLVAEIAEPSNTVNQTPLETIVLLHGHSFDRRMWNPQFLELARHHRVVRYDLRGYGLSDLPVEGREYSHAADLVAVLDTLKIQKAHIVGLSLGSFVGLDFIALHSVRARSVTLASNGIHDGDGARACTGAALGLRLAEIDRTRAQGIATLKTNWREALLRSAGPHAENLRPLLTAMIDDWSAWQPLHVEPKYLLGPDALPLIAKNKPTIPVLLLNGATDTHARKIAARIQAVISQACLVELPDAGHLSNLEQPEAFTAALEKFFTKTKP